jgi:hypothetical protein
MHRMSSTASRIDGPVARMYGAALGAFATAAIVAHATGQPDAFTVLAVVIAITAGRVARSGGFSATLTTIVALPVIGIATAATVELLQSSLWAAGAVYTVAVTGAGFVRRFGPTAARLGRLVTLPLLVVFIAPAPLGGTFGSRVGWSLLACAIAAAWVLLATSIPSPPGRDLHAAARALPRARTAVPIHRAIVALDRELRRLDGDADARALRVAAFDAETRIAADPPHAHAVLAELRDRALRIEPVRTPPPARPRMPATRSTRRLPASTRLALQSGAAIALAFSVGHTLFPDHWAWTVITVFAVTGAARSRGDVLHRSLLRLAGALAGTTVATLLTGPLSGHRDLAVVAILALLGLGLAGRERTYAAWAASVTGMLALLYGLYGETGTALLHTRLEAILVGALCAIAPAWFVLPIRGQAVVRRHRGDMLHAFGDLAHTLGSEDPHAVVVHWRAFEGRAHELSETTRSMGPQARRIAAQLHAVVPAVRRLALDARAGIPIRRERIAAVRGMFPASPAAPPPAVSSMERDGDHAHDEPLEHAARRGAH